MLINFVARANKCQGSVARKTGIKSREISHVCPENTFTVFLLKDRLFQLHYG